MRQLKVVAYVWLVLLLPNQYAMQSISKGCKLDIAILLDQSTSMYEHWNEVITFLQQFVNFLDIGEDGVHVALVTFSRYPEVQFYLDEYTRKEDLRIAIAKKAGEPRGDTATSRAFYTVRTLIFNDGPGDRDDARNVQLLITNGDPEKHQIPWAKVQADMTKSYGIRLLAIGMEGVGNEMMHGVVTFPPSDFFQFVDSINKLYVTNYWVLQQACRPWDSIPISTEKPETCDCKYGMCVRETNGKMGCHCEEGFSSTKCDSDNDLCNSKSLCQNGAMCEDQGFRYQCHCPPNYTGRHCETSTSQCDESICPHGKCTGPASGQTCECEDDPNTPQDECSIDHCATNPCQGGGTCLDLGYKYLCQCPNNYHGPECQYTFECAKTTPCVMNTVMCIDMVDDYHCDCVPGYGGKHCETEIDECESNPCEHGGKCQDWLNDFSCTCTSGYGGKTCDVNTNECEPNPCVHGTCLDGEVSFTCYCFAGYFGDLCDKGAGAGRDVKGSDTGDIGPGDDGGGGEKDGGGGGLGIVIGAAVGGLAVIIAVIAGVVVFLKKRQKDDGDADKANLPIEVDGTFKPSDHRATIPFPWTFNKNAERVSTGVGRSKHMVTLAAGTSHQDITNKAEGMQVDFPLQ